MVDHRNGAGVNPASARHPALGGSPERPPLDYDRPPQYDGMIAERDVRVTLPERELTRGWLKASHRALDEERSTPWKPFHRLTREAQEPVEPGEVVEYDIEILATANQFRKGHRICLDIASMDVPTGVAGATNAEYVPYHVNSSRTTVHSIYHSTRHPSRLLLPVIPETEADPGAEHG